MLLDALSHIPTRVGTASANIISLECKPTAGERSRVLNLLPLPSHHIALDELVPKVRDLHVQARGISGWVVLLAMALNHLCLNCPSDSAGRADHGSPTLVQLEALGHLPSSVAIFLISRSLIGPRSSPRKEWRAMARR